MMKSSLLSHSLSPWSSPDRHQSDENIIGTMEDWTGAQTSDHSIWWIDQDRICFPIRPHNHQEVHQTSPEFPRFSRQRHSVRRTSCVGMFGAQACARGACTHGTAQREECALKSPHIPHLFSSCCLRVVDTWQAVVLRWLHEHHGAMWIITRVKSFLSWARNVVLSCPLLPKHCHLQVVLVPNLIFWY